jgi:hypothetical protein
MNLKRYFRNAHISLLPLWHGTSPSVLESILTTGFANLATTDVGFFGKGLYILSFLLFTLDNQNLYLFFSYLKHYNSLGRQECNLGNYWVAVL